MRQVLKKERLLLLFLLSFLPTFSFGQTQVDTIKQEDLVDLRSKEFRSSALKVGLQLEGISASIILDHKISKKLNLGIRVGFGSVDYSFIILAGRHFATDYSLKYEKRDESDKEFFTEKFWTDAFLSYRQKSLELQFGLRRSTFHHYHSTSSSYLSGRFHGIFFQPIYQRRIFGFGLRIQAGLLTEGRIRKRKEFAITGSPFVMIIKLRPPRYNTRGY